MDQSTNAKNFFVWKRGDCCLGFCGDTQVAYPLFMQVSSTLNNYTKTRTRASDITEVASIVGDILSNNLIGSWSLPVKEKSEELNGTKILFAGWSWKYRRFEIGIFKYEKNCFNLHHAKAKIPHPWAEVNRSLVFIGDHQSDYMTFFESMLQNRHGKHDISTKHSITFDYEPIHALALMLRKNTSTKPEPFPKIGGSPQILKIYTYGNDLPFVIRMSLDEHYLFGRRLFS